VKLQRKRHIGNDIVCVVFLEADNTSFSPACIKSHFLHTFILVRVSPRIKRKITRYEVSVVTRDEVGAYKPYLWEQSVFEKGIITFSYKTDVIKRNYFYLKKKKKEFIYKTLFHHKEGNLCFFPIISQIFYLQRLIVYIMYALNDNINIYSQ